MKFTYDDSHWVTAKRKKNNKHSIFGIAILIGAVIISIRIRQKLDRKHSQEEDETEEIQENWY